MHSVQFTDRLRSYLRTAGSTQHDLAQAMNLHPGVLGRKLRGSANAFFTQQEIKRIITILVDWCAISLRSEVIELLELADMTTASLSEEEWHTPPLCNLDMDSSAPPVHEIAPSPTALHIPHLPYPMTQIIGRQWEVQRLKQLITDNEVRLLTLIGAAGSGKTRLAMEVAHVLRPSFADNVCWCALAGVHDPDLLPAQLLQALGLKASPGIASLHILIRSLRDQRLLLVLDNFEHLNAAADAVSELLEAVPGLSVLVTSREVLHLYGEYEFRVAPLPLPAAHDTSDPLALYRNPAIQLFVERVQMVQPSFTLNSEVSMAIAQICIALDGLPLALELAAARTKLVPPTALLPQLEASRLAVLDQGARNAHPHRQTLRETLQWSYDLLEQHEQQLFRRLAIFGGNFSLEAVERVCTLPEDNAHYPPPMMDRLAELLDKSMLVRLEQAQADEQPRFRLLETIREYGLDQLRVQDEEATLWRSYAHYYLTLAEEIQPRLFATEQRRWIALLVLEHENLLTVLQWFLKTAQGEAALRLCNALCRFWWLRGFINEGMAFLLQSLAIGTDAPKIERAKALSSAGILAGLYDVQRAEELLAESVALFRAVQDSHSSYHPFSQTLNRQGLVTWSRGDYALARQIVKEALELAQQRGDSRGTSQALLLLAVVNMGQGTYAEAVTQAQEARDFYRKIGDESYASACVILAMALTCQQEFTRARQLLEEELAVLQEEQYPFDLSQGLLLLGLITLQQGDVAQAQAHFKRNLQLSQRNCYWSFIAMSSGNLAAISLLQGDTTQPYALLEQCRALEKELIKTSAVAISIVGLAAAITVQGKPTFAARLLGYLEAFSEATHAVRSLTSHWMFVITQAFLHTQLGTEAYAIAYAQGREMTLEEVLEAANRI